MKATSILIGVLAGLIPLGLAHADVGQGSGLVSREQRHAEQLQAIASLREAETAIQRASAHITFWKKQLAAWQAQHDRTCDAACVGPLELIGQHPDGVKLASTVTRLERDLAPVVEARNAAYESWKQIVASR